MRKAIHLERSIKAPVGEVYGAFERTRSMRVWYDPRSNIDRFKVGSKLEGENYPSAEILALVPNHTIVHRYIDIVSGLGIWSFVEKNGGRSTLLVFDHVDAYDNKEDRDSITFYWIGLVENLAAFCEGRELTFDHDAGEYKRGMKRRA